MGREITEKDHTLKVFSSIQQYCTLQLKALTAIKCLFLFHSEHSHQGLLRCGQHLSDLLTDQSLLLLKYELRNSFLLWNCLKAAIIQELIHKQIMIPVSRTAMHTRCIKYTLGIETTLAIQLNPIPQELLILFTQTVLVCPSHENLAPE